MADELNIEKLLPDLSEGEKAFIATLPERFSIECPYREQQEMWWSGAACIQMLYAFHGEPEPSQAEIAAASGSDGWLYSNHETLEDDVIRFMAKRNFIPSIYFPALHVMKHFESYIDGGDFIYKNVKQVQAIDFSYYKSILVKTETPVFIRIHFTTKDYNMPEDLARVIDTVGHGLLMVGYDHKGIIVNDPWDRAKWGGKNGGQYRHISYELLGGPNLPVNGTLDFVGSFTRLQAVFQMPNRVPFPDREIEIPVNIRNLGLFGIVGDRFALKNVRLLAHAPEGMDVLEMSGIISSLAPGEEAQLSVQLRTGKTIGSFPLRATIHASMELPVRPWERNAVHKEIVTITADAHTRVDVKNPKWFSLYGR